MKQGKRIAENEKRKESFEKFLFESLQNLSMVVGSESLTRFHPDAPCEIIPEYL